MRYYLEEDRAKVLKSSSLKQTISQLKTFFDWVYLNGWLDNKFQYSWKLSHEKSRQLNLYQAQQNSTDPFNLFEQYISSMEFDFFLGFVPRKRTFERERDSIILKLAYYSGLRRAEIVDPHNISLKRIKAAIKSSEDQGIDGFYLDIIGKGKSGGKVRKIYVPPRLRKEIEAFIRGPLKRRCPLADLLICKVIQSKTFPLNKNHATALFNDTLNNLLSIGDVGRTREWRTHEKQRRFHSLRHSFATNYASVLRDNSEPIKRLQERMGHTHESTTHIYIHFEALMAKDFRRADQYSFDPHKIDKNKAWEELSDDQG